MWQSLWGDVDRRVRLGRILGLLFIALGFGIIFQAWNGAASKNIITAQFPYLISGGVMGLGLILTGSLLLFLATLRAERQIMTEQFEEITRLLGRNLSRLQYSANGADAAEAGEQVVPGPSVYHRPDCRILEGKDNLATITIKQAAAEGLNPCRVCSPPPPPPEAESDAASEPAPERKEEPAATSGAEKPAP